MIRHTFVADITLVDVDVVAKVDGEVAQLTSVQVSKMRFSLDGKPKEKVVIELINILDENKIQQLEEEALRTHNEDRISMRNEAQEGEQ